MTNRKVFAVLVSCATLLLLLTALGTGTFAPLELEAAIEDDTDTQESGYVFEINGTEPVEVEIVSPHSETRDGGEVIHEFVRWEVVDGDQSGTDPSWIADPGVEYRVVYESTAQSEASPGTYSFDFEAQTDDQTFETTFDVEVVHLEPEFGTASPDPGTVVFGPEDEESASTTMEVAIPNDGNGVLIPTNAEIHNEPNGFDVTVESLPDRIESQDEEPVSMDIEVDESVSEGSYQFSLTVEDNLENGVDIPVTVEVFRPPVVEPDPDSLDIGEVLINETESATVDIEEVTGHGDADNLAVIYAQKTQADLDSSELEHLDVPAADSRTVELSVSALETAEQGEELAWTLTLEPDTDPSVRSQLDVTAEVIYPPYFGELSASEGEIEFDQPRQTTDRITDTVSIEVPNDGDLRMNVVDAEASIDGDSVDAELTSTPDTIDAQSSETVLVEVAADAETLFGDRTLTVTVESEEDGTESISTDVAIIQVPDVEASQQTVDLGEMPIGTRESVSVGLEERLGYRDVEGFDVTVADSPDDDWFEVSLPNQLTAGEEESIDLEVEFDASADLFTTYGWTFEVEGENIDSFEIDVVATPRPVECTDVVNDLEQYSGPSSDVESVADSISDAIRIVEDEAREGEDQSLDDVANACAAGRATLLFLNANEEFLAVEETAVQQEAAARMAFGFNTIERSGETIQNDRARSRTEEALDVANDVLDSRLSERESAVQERLTDASVLEEARAKTELARLVGLRGDDATATETRAEADEAFERYVSLVSEGNERLDAARETDQAARESLFVSAFGQDVFWIGDLDDFRTKEASIIDDYDAAVDNFEQAGASERAQSARAERSDVESSYQITLVFSGTLAALVGLAFVFLLYYEAKAIYRYIQDVGAARTGSSLI